MSFNSLRLFFKKDNRLLAGAVSRENSFDGNWKLVGKLFITEKEYGLFDVNHKKWVEFGVVTENFWEEFVNVSTQEPDILYTMFKVNLDKVRLNIYKRCEKKKSKFHKWDF